MLEIKCGGIKVVTTGLIQNQFGIIPPAAQTPYNRNHFLMGDSFIFVNRSFIVP